MAVSRRPIYPSVPVDMYHRRPDLSGVWKHVVAAGGRRMVTRVMLGLMSVAVPAILVYGAISSRWDY